MVYMFSFLIFYFGIIVFNSNILRICSMFSFISMFLVCFFKGMFFNKISFGFNLIKSIFVDGFLNMNFMFGYDGMSLYFLVLSIFLLLYCVLLYWWLYYSLTEYMALLFVLVGFLFCVFSVLDILLFYMFFEGLVMPLFLMMLIWGSSERKVYAAYMFFFFTLFGSLFVLMFILDFYLSNGSLNYSSMLYGYISKNVILFWFMLIFLGFSVKIPMIPFHVWLPEAHVEAPTGGSVLLAGIVLKLSFYAFISLLFSFGFGVFYVEYLLILMAIFFFGLVYSSFGAFVQIDLKKMIAYSSVAHMNFAMMGFFGKDFIGITGSFFMMLGHAIVSSSLFMCIGLLYDSYKTSLIFYFGGMSNLMPFFSMFFFMFMLGNFGFPGTVNFVGEFLMMVGVILVNNFLIFFSSMVLIITLIYSLFSYTKVVFGQLNMAYYSYFCDITVREFCYLGFMVFLVLLFGINPVAYIDLVYFNLLKFSSLS